MGDTAETQATTTRQLCCRGPAISPNSCHRRPCAKPPSRKAEVPASSAGHRLHSSFFFAAWRLCARLLLVQAPWTIYPLPNVSSDSKNPPRHPQRPQDRRGPRHPRRRLGGDRPARARRTARRGGNRHDLRRQRRAQGHGGFAAFPGGMGHRGRFGFGGGCARRRTGRVLGALRRSRSHRRGQPPEARARIADGLAGAAGTASDGAFPLLHRRGTGGGSRTDSSTARWKGWSSRRRGGKAASATIRCSSRRATRTRSPSCRPR